MKKLVTLVSVFALFLTSSFSLVEAPQTPAPRIDIQPTYGGEPLPHPQTIYVKMRLNGNVAYIPLLVFFQDPVLYAKSQLADILDIPMERFDLTYRGVILDEGLTLNDYRISTGAYLGIVYY